MRKLDDEKIKKEITEKFAKNFKLKIRYKLLRNNFQIKLLASLSKVESSK